MGRDRGVLWYFTPKKRAQMYKGAGGVVVVAETQFLLHFLDVKKSLCWQKMWFNPRSRTNGYAEGASPEYLQEELSE